MQLPVSLSVLYIFPVTCVLAQEPGSLRLVCADGQSGIINGTTTLVSAGRLEIYYHPGEGQPSWGTVCTDGFDELDADVACQQMGFMYATRVGSTFLLGYSPGPTSSPVWLENVECDPSHARLLDCDRSSTVTCGHNKDVAVHCINHADPLRLVSQGGHSSRNLSNSISTGRLEILINNQWGTVCDHSFNTTDADVACRILGFPYGSITFTSAGSLIGYTHISSPTTPIWLDKISCSENSVNLRACGHSGTGNTDCSHDEDVILSCLADGSVRLISSRHQTSDIIFPSGRLEVYVNGRWGTVCVDGFSIIAAHIACRQLGFVGARNWGGLGSFPAAPNGTDILLDNIDCSTTDLTLLSCAHNGIGVHDCNSLESVAVYCEESRPTEENPTSDDSGSKSSPIAIIAGLVPVFFFIIFLCVPVILWLIIHSYRGNWDWSGDWRRVRRNLERVRSRLRWRRIRSDWRRARDRLNWRRVRLDLQRAGDRLNWRRAVQHRYATTDATTERDVFELVEYQGSPYAITRSSALDQEPSTTHTPQPGPAPPIPNRPSKPPPYRRPANQPHQQGPTPPSPNQPPKPPQHIRPAFFTLKKPTQEGSASNQSPQLEPPPIPSPPRYKKIGLNILKKSPQGEEQPSPNQLPQTSDKSATPLATPKSDTSLTKSASSTTLTPKHPPQQTSTPVPRSRISQSATTLTPNQPCNNTPHQTSTPNFQSPSNNPNIRHRNSSSSESLYFSWAL